MAIGACSPGRAAAEVLSATMISPFHIFNKILIDVFHTMRSQPAGSEGIQVTGRNDYIGIYIIAVFEYGSFAFSFL